jgi:hypothetical protein
VRTTIDLPDAVFRETKALAALRGVTLKQFVLDAIEQARHSPPHSASPDARRTFRPVHLKSGQKLSLRDFDFDDLLA